MKAKSISILLLVLAIGLAPNRMLAQANRGAIKGQVQDAQRASVPDAQITLTNEGTGVTAKTTSGSSGTFNFVDLSPGAYTLATEAKGFSSSVQQNIAVDVGRTLALTVTLKPGEVQQTVTVTANSAAVESQTADIGTTLTPQEPTDLPRPMRGDMRN
ncbi:MAG: carboxypeptidase-like regulatory domain-containing protein, partial [Rhodanobacteraceae bacterium]